VGAAALLDAIDTFDAIDTSRKQSMMPVGFNPEHNPIARTLTVSRKVPVIGPPCKFAVPLGASPSW